MHKLKSISYINTYLNNNMVFDFDVDEVKEHCDKVLEICTDKQLIFIPCILHKNFSCSFR